MRTQRLYQRDSTLTRFRASVLDARAAPAAVPAGSARLAVLLDRTAFYPTGGGQPHDTGHIAALPVVDVVESEDGPLHIVELRDAQGRPHGAHLTVGSEIEATIDWSRRFDHMQQHSGQHILTRAFVETASAATRSFHLGELLCTIDVEMAEPDDERIRAAEARANEIIWSDRPVQVRELEPGEAREAPVEQDLREPNLKPGDALRIIEIEGFDATPCGGTHVARTGQVGIAGVLGWERVRGMCRVTFVCGGRAAAQLRESTSALSACVAKLSARPHELPNAIDRLLLDREELARRVRELGRAVAADETARLAASAIESGPWRVLRKIYRAEERSVEEAQSLVRSFVQPPGRLALVAVTSAGTGTLLVARSEEAATTEGATGPPIPRVGEVIAEVCRDLGGRGGGGPHHARAGGLPVERLEAAFDAIQTRLAAPATSRRP